MRRLVEHTNDLGTSRIHDHHDERDRIRFDFDVGDQYSNGHDGCHSKSHHERLCLNLFRQRDWGDLHARYNSKLGRIQGA